MRAAAWPLLALLDLFDLFSPASATQCCHDAEPVITKFAQVDHDPNTLDEAVLSMPFGQRALEIFNPSCEDIDLADFEVAIVNPRASEDGAEPITRVSLNPGAHATGGRGHGSAWNVPSLLPAGKTFVLCTYPIVGTDVLAGYALQTALQDSSSLPGTFALSASINCTVASPELTSQAKGSGEGSILLVRTEDDSIVDAIAGIPRVDRSATQQECSVLAKRLEQFRHGNAHYNRAEWIWIWGTNCEGHAEVTISSEPMDRYGADMCGLADDGKFIDHSYLHCADWRFYDCSLSHRTCGPGMSVGCSYSPEEEERLLLACPHSCGLCGNFGWEEVPEQALVAAAEADNPGFIAPNGACANRSSTARVAAAGSAYATGPPAVQEMACCPGALPTITMFAQLGVEPYPQRVIEVFNPSCAKAFLEDYELAFIGEDRSGRYNETIAVIPLNDVRLFKDTFLTEGDTLVLCSDFSHNMMSDEVFQYDDGEGNPNVYSEYPFLVQYIEEESTMPHDLVGSTWDKCTGNMSSLPRGRIKAVALRSSIGGAVVDFLPLGVPALADPGSNLACSVAWTRKPPDTHLAPGDLPPTTNSPSYNSTQWSEPIVGAGCTTIPAQPGGWQDQDLSSAELKFGQRGTTRGWDATTQCSAPITALPASSLLDLVRSQHTSVESTCCEVGRLMITKVVQLDVQFTESWTGQYQQRAIEIYNPTCQPIRLADFDLLFLDDEKQIVGQVPLVINSGQTLAPQQTHVICAQTGSTEPNMENGVDRMHVSQRAHIPPNLVQSAETQCDVSPLSPDGTTAWLLLPGLHGTLVLRRVPAMNPLNSKGLSCNLAWVREQRVRTCSPAFNSSDWMRMVGVNCEDQPSALAEHFQDWYPATFGQRDWLTGVVDDPCLNAQGILASDFGVTEPVNPPRPPVNVTANPDPCAHVQGQPNVPSHGPDGLPHPCRNSPHSAPSKTLFDILGVVVLLIIGTCFVCACIVCCWVRQRRKGKFASSAAELEMQLGVGGYMTSISMAPQQDYSYTSPLADQGIADFTVTVGAGELRQEISANILASKGGANVTPWGGAFIMDDLSAGDTFDNKVKVGKGSYGTVYKATFRGHMVAVKEIEIDFDATNARQNESAQAALREFKQELQVWCKLMHPNVVQFYGYTTTPVCIVQEFIEGGTLYELLTSSAPMTTDTRMSFALDVARGMSYLHGLLPPIIHRDLKSLNLLVAAGPPGHPPTVKLTDFGLARSKQTMMGETAKMTQVGTPYWTAPEIFDDATYNESADVYSFAMVLYEIWSRKLPWQGLQPVQVALKVVNERARPPVPVEMDTEECFGISALMSECWGHDPSRRPSFEDCVLRLEEQFAIRRELGSGAEQQQQQPLNSPARTLSTASRGVFSMTLSRTSSGSTSGGTGVPLSIEVTGRAGPPYAVIMPTELLDAPMRDGVVGLRRLLEGQLGMQVLEMMHWDPDFEEFCLLEDLKPMQQSAESGGPTPVRLQISHASTGLTPRGTPL
jgi:serine/threonine protein kinase